MIPGWIGVRRQWVINSRSKTQQPHGTPERLTMDYKQTHPSQNEKAMIISKVAGDNRISIQIAEVIYNTLGYGGGLRWYVVDGAVVITTEGKYRHIIDGFRDICLKSLPCGEINYLESTGDWAFIVKNSEVK